jgi:hypothetical protein
MPIEEQFHQLFREQKHSEIMELLNQSVVIDPRVEVDNVNLIQLCFELSQQDTYEPFISRMLQNVVYPLLDRALIREDKAKRGDIMKHLDDGSFVIHPQESDTLLPDSLTLRRIGKEDGRLSAFHQQTLFKTMADQREQAREASLRRKY